MKYIYLLFIIFGLLGCQKSSNSNVITIVMDADPKSLNPIITTSSFGMKLSDLLYQGLNKIGPNGGYKLDLAQKISISKSRLEFKISTSHNFWDGSPVTCSDLLYSIESFQKKPSPFKNAFKVISNVICTKDSHLVLGFDISVNIDKFLRTDLPVLKIIKKDTYLNDFQEPLPLGTGSFQVQSLSHQKIIFKRKDGLLFNFEILKDPFMRYVKTYKGDIDIAIGSLPLNKIKFLKEQKHLDVITSPSLNTTYLLLNQKNSWLQSKKNRQYLNQIIDTKLLIQYHLSGYAIKAQSFMPPLSIFSRSFTPLTEIKEDMGQIPSLSFKTSNAKSSREKGRLLKDQMRLAGVPVRLQSFEWGTYLKDVNKGNYDLALLKWVGVLDPDIYRMAYHSDEIPPKGRNRSFYNNPTLDKLLDKGLATSENAERKEIYNQVQKLVYDESISIPLWHESLVTVKSKRILNYVPDSRGSFLPLRDIQLSLQKD